MFPQYFYKKRIKTDPLKKKISVQLVGTSFVFIFGSGQPYHRTVPNGGITVGMGQDQSGLPRIRTWVLAQMVAGGQRPKP